MSAGDAAEEELFGAGDGLLDHILDRLRAGEALDLDALAREFPAHSEEIPRLVQLVGFVHGAAQSIHPLRDLEARLALGETPELDGYIVQRLLARGGMGIVFEALDPMLDRRVAIKLLCAGPEFSEREVERFRREARNASRLNHPHVVPIYGVGDLEGIPYYAMRFIDGRSLAQVAREERHARSTSPVAFAQRVARWGEQAASALAHAHQAGIVHRDVKPSNILIDARDLAYVTDFGLARQMGDATLTQSGELIGTLRSMSPEQARGGSVLDERTDIYSLGATLYELLAGRPVFDGETREEVLRKVLMDEPPALRSLVPGIPKDLATLVHKAISKRVEDRYSSAQLMREDLQRLLAGQPTLARPQSIFEQVRSLDHRYRWPVRGALVSFCLLSVLVIVISLQTMRISNDRDRIMEESKRALGVQEFLAGMLFYANPKGRHSVNDFDALLDRVALGLGEEFAEDAATEADLRFRLGDVLWTRSRLADADTQLGIALSRGREAFGMHHAWVTNAALYHASLLHFLGRNNESLAILAELDVNHLDPVEHASLLGARAKALTALGDCVAGTAAMRQSVQIHIEQNGLESEDTAHALESLSELLLQLGDVAGGIEAQRNASDILVKLRGQRDQVALISRCYLATRLMQVGDMPSLEEARSILRDTITMFRSAERPSPIDQAWATGLLARSEWQLDDPGASEAHFLEALHLLRARLGEHLQVGQTLGSYGEFLVSEGRYEEATRVLEEAHALNLSLLGAENPTTLSSHERLKRARAGLALQK